MLFQRESLDSAEGKAARLARVPRGDVVCSIQTRGEQKNSPRASRQRPESGSRTRFPKASCAKLGKKCNRKDETIFSPSTKIASFFCPMEIIRNN